MTTESQSSLTDLPSSPPSKGALVAIYVFIALFILWGLVALTWVMPTLWGPYSQVFLDAGPLAASRGGFFLCLEVLPWLALILPIITARTVLQWICKQVLAVLVVAVALLGYGRYLHTIVNQQGVQESTEYLAAEVGFKDAASVPPHVKEALALSGRLAAEGKAPWLPGAWKQVTWPAIPQQTK